MGKLSEFNLPLKSLPEGEHAFSYHLDKHFFENMENADIRDANIDVALSVVHKNGVYDLTFRLTGTYVVACDRCLDNLELPIDTEYHIVVKYGDDYRDDADGLIEIPEGDNSLNVAYMIYDTVVLAIPIKHVHPLGKCNRQMTSLLKKHRAHTPADGDEELMEDLIDEMDASETAAPDEQAPANDPRWDVLRDIARESTDDND